MRLRTTHDQTIWVSRPISCGIRTRRATWERKSSAQWLMSYNWTPLNSIYAWRTTLSWAHQGAESKARWCPTSRSSESLQVWYSPDEPNNTRCTWHHRKTTHLAQTIQLQIGPHRTRRLAEQAAIRSQQEVTNRPINKCWRTQVMAPLPPRWTKRSAMKTASMCRR